MNIEPDDINRLAHEVRLFLGKGDMLTRLSGMATLYLEFQDVGTMRTAHKAIILAIRTEAAMHVDGAHCEYVDDHTIRLEPIFGIQIVLSCKQRFATTSGGSLGYRDIAFRDVNNRASGRQKE